jgi:hypothetical protein
LAANTLRDYGNWTRAAHIGTRVIYPDERMKQAQSETTRHYSAGRWWSRKPIERSYQRQAGVFFNPRARSAEQSNSWWWGDILVTLIAAIWFVVSLPFRLLFWTIAWLGRLTAVVLGFILMVIGIALWAGPLFFIGIPLFLVGLVLTLRCLE